MPYYVNVGPFTSNGGRPGARGYHIQRRLNRVRVTWGGIVVSRRRSVVYAWSSTTQFKEYACGSAQAAGKKLKELDRERTGREVQTSSAKAPNCPDHRESGQRKKISNRAVLM